MHFMKLISLFLLLGLTVIGCRKDTPEPTTPADNRLARVISYNSRDGSDYASEDQYEYNPAGQLVRLNMMSRNNLSGQLVQGRHYTYAYDSTGRLLVKTTFSQLNGIPSYANQEWRYTYPTPTKVIETTYSVFPANSPGGAGAPHKTSYSETLLEGGQPVERTYFNREGEANGTFAYTYANGRIQREEFRRDNAVVNSTQYTYAGNTVKVESFMTGYQGRTSERRQTLDAKGRVVRDEVVFQANIYFEPYMGPDTYIYEYLN